MNNVHRAADWTAEDFDELLARVRGYERPLLSLYANVHPARRETLSHPVAIRAKNTLRELRDVPEGLREAVLDYFENRPSQARAVAIFGNSEHLELLELDVPVDDPPDDRLTARYGEPDLSPLLEVIQRHSPRVAVFVDRDDVHVFRVYMGRAACIFEQEREPTAGEQDEIGLSKGRLPDGVKSVAAPATRSPQTAGHQQNGPQYIADRGDAAKQLRQERIEHSQVLFYKECSERIRELLAQTPDANLMLIGPERERHLMLSAMPDQLSKRVSVLLRRTRAGAPSSSEVLQLEEEARGDIDAQREDDLLSAIAERGVLGLEPCLAALQEGRLHRLAVPASLRSSAYLERRTDYVTTHEPTAKKLGGEIEEVDLASRLPELAEKWGARIELLRGEQERKLVEELGGLGGLRRW